MTGFPVVELIAQTVAARVANVQTANGFRQDVAAVVRPVRLGGYSPCNFLAVLIQDDPTRDPACSELSDVICWRQPFGVILFVAPSESDTAPVEQVINVFRSDVEKAICTDPAGNAWWHFSELAGQPLAAAAHLAEPKSIPSTDGAIEGITVWLEVTYLTPAGDPYSVA